MNGLSFSATTEKRKGILLDPRTKLILLLTITTLMFSTSNEGIMNIVKPCLSLVPFALILSERRFKTSGKYLVLYAVCFILERIALASAIASKRSILFFDEPTSGLDYKHMKEVANVLKQVRDAGITLYVITHDLELLLDCCTDIVHFEDGSIIDKFQMDEAGLEKIRNYFIKGVPTK